MPTESDCRRERTIKHLIRLLREARVRQGLSQNEVGKRAGLSHTMVLRVEKGERVPSIATLLRLTDAMDVDLAGLIAEATEAAENGPS